MADQKTRLLVRRFGSAERQRLPTIAPGMPAENLRGDSVPLLPFGYWNIVALSEKYAPDRSLPGPFLAGSQVVVNIGLSELPPKLPERACGARRRKLSLV
jgi:hypothetical protein